MDSKEYLTNRNFCPIPWTGLMYNFDGTVKNCIRSSTPIGNLKDNHIQEILSSEKNIATKKKMLENLPGDACSPCYNLEQKKHNFDTISDRVFYLRELKNVNQTVYDNIDTFELNTVDARWTNLCNFSCVYCSPEFSSKWASELNITANSPTDNQKKQLQEYIFNRAKNLQHVYLAGGEPLLMKENAELLEKLLKENPTVNLRINTNLSKVDTKNFDLICKFPNVQWIVSVETKEEEYEYIRYGGKWLDFISNLEYIKKLNHKISFNMLHFLLNFQSLFNCIEFLKQQGFHNNSFIIGPVTKPDYFDIRHLPEHKIDEIKKIIQIKINDNPGFLLENSYVNLLNHLDKKIVKNLNLSFQNLSIIDNRRGLNSKLIFKDLYKYE